VEHELRHLRYDNKDLALKIEMDGHCPKISCHDCPHYAHRARDTLAVSRAIPSLETHLKTKQHITNIRKRLASEEALIRRMVALLHRNPNSKFESRTSSNLLVPEIFCKVCPDWVYKMGTNFAIAPQSAALNHLETADHKKCTLLVSHVIQLHKKY